MTKAIISKKKPLNSIVYTVLGIVAFVAIMMFSDYLEEQSIYSEAEQPSKHAVLEFIKDKIGKDAKEIIVVDKDIRHIGQTNRTSPHYEDDNDMYEVTYIFEVDGEQYEVVSSVVEFNEELNYRDTSSVKHLSK